MRPESEGAGDAVKEQKEAPSWPDLPRLLRLSARLAPAHVGVPLRRDLRGAQQRQDPLGLPWQDPALTEDQLGLIGVLDDDVGQEPQQVRQRHTLPLQQVEQVRQDPVAAEIQVRYLVLAHPHGQVPPDEAALSEVDDERGRVERGRDQVEALHDGGGLEDLPALRIRAAGHRPRPALGHLTEPVVGEGVDRHDDVAPPLPQRLGQGDVNELGRPVGR